MNPEITLQPGTVIVGGMTPYTVVEVLGKGGFGITYLVTSEVKIGNVTTEAKFALKEHYPGAFALRNGFNVSPKPGSEADYATSMRDFLGEARKLQNLGVNNPNIVKVNEVFEANGTAYYVMQYINGQSLTSFVKSRGNLSEREALAIMNPIIDAVDYLHKSRVNHLDIKPANIMMHNGASGVLPTLIDFGLSVHFKKSGEETTNKGVQGVSEGYSPLEQYAGIKAFSPATDVYALAATLFFCLTGTKPLSASELRTVDLYNALDGKCSDKVAAAISRAMAKSSDDRTPTAADFKADLGLTQKPVSGNDTVLIGVKPSKSSAVASKSSSGVSKVLVGGLIGLVVAIAIVAGAWAFFNTNKPGEATKKDEKPTLQSTQEQPAQQPVEELATPEAAGRTDNATQPTPQANEESSKPAAEPSKKKESGPLNLGYATWYGDVRNGKPDGIGKMVFNSSHAVDPSSSAMASPGDYFQATYDSGNLISGKLYTSDGELIRTIIP